MPTDSRAGWLGGGAMLLGAAAYVVHLVARSWMTAGVDPAIAAARASWLAINVLGAAGAILVLLALPAVGIRLGDRLGRIGIIGLELLALGWLFFGVFLSLYGALVMPWLAERAAALLAPGTPPPRPMIAAFLLGLLAWFAGAVCVAVPILRRRVAPRWVGYLLPASALWAVIGNLVIAPSGPSSNLALNLLSNFGPVMLLAALLPLAHRGGRPPARDGREAQAEGRAQRA